MPIYEYECGSCGRRFDELQRIMDDALATDPECGGPVRRVIQPVGIIFKGSGFYVNDSRKTASSSSSADSSTTDSTKSDSTKSDAKSETKTESSSSTSSGDSSSSSTPSKSSSGDSKPAAAAAK